MRFDSISSLKVEFFRSNLFANFEIALAKKKKVVKFRFGSPLDRRGGSESKG